MTRVSGEGWQARLQLGAWVHTRSFPATPYHCHLFTTREGGRHPKKGAG